MNLIDKSLINFITLDVHEKIMTEGGEKLKQKDWER